MPERTSNSLRNAALRIVERLQNAGFEAYWVGGCVRDFLLGREPMDYDVATSALAAQVEELFPRTQAVGRKFGVLLVRSGRHEVQVATFRAEAEYRDGRHPEKVVFGDARADASRRDFTINGLFYDPVRGQLHDWVGGQADLTRKLIRTIGVPTQRFSEDRLRLLRAVRLAAQLDFKIEQQTFHAIKTAAPGIAEISAERVRDELLKLFRPPYAARGLELLRESGLLAQILPEIAAMERCEQSADFHPEGDVFQHVLLMLKYLPADADLLLPWAVLLHDVAKPLTAWKNPESGSIHFYGHERLGADMAHRILERLRFPRRQIENVVKAVRCHMQFKDVLQMRKATLRRLLLRPTFPLELQLHRLDCLGSHGELDIYDYLVQQSRELEQQPRLRPPLLTGYDLIELGMRPGPEMGKLLAEIRDLQLQEELHSCAEARKWVRERIGRPPK